MDVTVVIPLYEKASTIRRAVESVRAQTVAVREVIVVDDGSRDGGADRIADLAGSWLRIVRQPNRGVSAARNLAVEHARSEVIAFLDADDEWMPHHVGDLCAALAAVPEAVAAGTGFVTRDDAGNVRHPRPSGHIQPFRIPDYFGYVADYGLPFTPSAAAARRDVLRAIGGFPLGVGSGEDLVVWARLACAGPIAHHPRESTVYYVPDLFNVRARSPVHPDPVAAALAELADHAGASPRFGEYRATWSRIRALSHAEASERIYCLRELATAVMLGVPLPRDMFVALSLALPRKARLRLYSLARARHIVRPAD